MRDLLLVVSVFLACAVEAVEALTVVLAVGISRGWRSTWQGVAVALGVLAAVVAVLGPALSVVPLESLRLVVGALLLVFGLGWLRKAVLRGAGLKALHDEDAIYARQLAAAREANRGSAGVLVDAYAFTLAFKAVLLEGLEVAFIVLTFGANQHSIPLAAAAAVAAVLVVTAAGIAVRAPLARVPENTLKFAVGVLLTSFGMFWAVEGAGGSWPGSDASLPAVIGFVLGTALACVAWLRRRKARQLLTVGASSVNMDVRP